MKKSIFTIVAIAAASAAAADITPAEKMLETPAEYTITSPAGTPGRDGLTVQLIGNTNTLVRIAPEVTQPLLILPVQESMPDAKVDILVDGNVAHTFYVRLADSEVDYTVPLDLAPYLRQGTVMLNIESETDRSHQRDISEMIAWDEIHLADSFDTANTERYRPAFHHTPLYGWMNDPNGMFYADGTWHLYYQYNPYGSKWQNMSWGHSTSPDLVNWTHQPVALRPDGNGSIFSGSAAVVSPDTIVAMYTSANKCQVQSIAFSTDGGMSFTPYAGNPVIANYREARDPKIFFHAPSGKWVMVMADPLEQQMQIYNSDDLKHWTYQSSFGKGYGSQFGVWECPDLFELPVEGTGKSKWVLLCNINPGGPFGGSATQYFVGDFDGHTFTCDSPARMAKWMDYGKDHYATVSWSNAPHDRRTVIGWMSNWQYANEVPTQQFRSANTLPRDLGLFRHTDGEIYLTTRPAPEVESLRATPTTYPARNIDGQAATYPLPTANSGICEIVVDYNTKGCSQLTFTLSNSKGEQVVMNLDPALQQITMDRTASGVTRFSRQFKSVTMAPTHSNKAAGQLRLFIDRSSVEAFDGADGRWVMTNLVFPTEPYSTLTISTPEGSRARIPSVTVYPLNPAK